MKSFVKPERDSLLRTVRIVFTDPDATDDSSSSSDEWLPKPRKVKRFVHEITFLPQVSESSQDRSNAVKTPRRKSTRQFKYPVGVRPRPSGKFAAEILNPFTKTKKWLGTYETPAEAEPRRFSDYPQEENPHNHFLRFDSSSLVLDCFMNF